MINVSINDREVKKILKNLGNDAKAKRIQSQATNRILTSTRAQLSKEVKKQINLKPAKIKDTMKIKKASTARPSGVIVIAGRPLLLSNYGAKTYGPKKRRKATTRKRARAKFGVSVKVGTKKKRKKMTGAVMMKLKSGKNLDGSKLGVAVWSTKTKKLKVLHGPNPYQVLKKDRRFNYYMNEASKKYAAELLRLYRLKMMKK